MNTLKYGSTGSEVKTLQTALNRAGCNLTVDGIFGSKTTTAVKILQKEYGLTVDGIVGPQTWEVLVTFMVSWEDLGKAMHQVIKDMENLPSFKKFMELLPND